VAHPNHDVASHSGREVLTMIYRTAVAMIAMDPLILAANDLPTIIGNITTWIIGLLIGVATLFFTIGGLRYLAAGGDPTEVEKAKSAFKSALVGYALAVLAPVLLGVVRGWIGG
jgi:hypothetical protein